MLLFSPERNEPFLQVLEKKREFFLIDGLTYVFQIRYTRAVRTDNFPMKKTLTTLLACVTLGMAYGEEAGQKDGFGLELNAAYNFALRDVYKYDEGSSPKVNTYGIDLTALYALNENHSFNIRLGWTTGDDSISESEEGFNTTDKWEVQNIYIMPGYRYTTKLTDSLSLFAGANIGLAQTKVTSKYSSSWEGVSEGEKDDKSKWGFAWSAEIGLQQKITETGHITLGVQLMQLLGRPDFGGDDGEGYESDKTESQLNLGVRLGYSCQF